MKKLNLFISYSHLDEDEVNEFKKYTSQLNGDGPIDTWYDRKIIAGKEFQDSIDNNINNSDIICLFVSANFISSSACQNEKIKSLELKKEKGVAVIPIILSACGWLDDSSISPKLALPTDGKPINTHKNSSDAWNDVYEGLKKVIDEEVKIKNSKITDQFLSFLDSTEMLTKAHSRK